MNTTDMTVTATLEGVACGVPIIALVEFTNGGRVVAGRRSISFREALRFWIKLGFISFGGLAGQIATMLAGGGVGLTWTLLTR